MENYIGKICPFCKTEITEADAVKVCTACGIPHHEGCWEENKGCTTFGCSEQHYEAQHTNPTDVCKKCGAPLGDGQAFCPKCGTPKVEEKKNVCGKCGAELQDGQEFCPKCGQKAGLAVDAGVSSAINQFNAGVNKTNEAKKKKPMKMIAAAVVAVAVIAIGVLVAPKLMVSVEDLCAEGNYLEAYEKADSGEKMDVLAENIIAVLSQESSDGLKDPSSFVLRDAWYYAFMHEDGAIGGYAVLYLSGANSYGAKVSNYWAYTLGDDGDWNYIGSVDVSYDEDDDDLEDMLTKIIVQAGMEKGDKLSKEQVKRINTQFEADTLYKVDAIDWDVVDTSSFPEA